MYKIDRNKYYMGRKTEGKSLILIYYHCWNYFIHLLTKSITCNTNIDIVTSSKRDRNDDAVVMQKNFTELIEINTSQSLKKLLVIKYLVL